MYRQIQALRPGFDATLELTEFVQLHWLWKLNYAGYIVAWISAMVFHTRDLYWTEKADYFSATFTVLLNAVACIARVFGTRFVTIYASRSKKHSGRQA